MWRLELCNSDATPVYLVHGRDLLVSRQVAGAWLHLSSDASISRKHAQLRLLHSPASVKSNQRSLVELVDLKAKNGTYVLHGGGAVSGAPPELTENERLPPGDSTLLEEGDVVRFGLYQHTYRLVRCPMVVATSMLPSSAALLANLLTLGATYSKEWTADCTHLVMDTIKLSAKVACALACSRCVVTPAFITAMVEAVQRGDQLLPHTDAFLPTITEPSIQPSPSLFAANSCRKRILQGRTFLFSSRRTCRKLAPVVCAAGGECEVLSPSHTPALLAGSALLVRVPEDARLPGDSDMARALGVLQGAGLQPVPESDIVLAVLYCSTDRFCNPALSQQQLLPAVQSTQTTQNTGVIYAPETQNFTLSPTKSGGKGNSAVVDSLSTCRSLPRQQQQSEAQQTITGSVTSVVTSKLLDGAAAAAQRSDGLRSEPGPGKENALLPSSNPQPGSDCSAITAEDCTVSFNKPALLRDHSQAKLSRKRCRSGTGSDIISAAKRCPPRTTIEPTQEMDDSQDTAAGEDEDLFADDVDVSSFVPPHASTQRLDDQQQQKPLLPAAAVSVRTSVPPTPTQPTQESETRTKTVPPTPTQPTQGGKITSMTVAPTPTLQTTQERGKTTTTTVPPTPTQSILSSGSNRVLPTPTPPMETVTAPAPPPVRGRLRGTSPKTASNSPPPPPPPPPAAVRPVATADLTLPLPSLAPETLYPGMDFLDVKNDPPPTLDFSSMDLPPRRTCPLPPSSPSLPDGPTTRPRPPAEGGWIRSSRENSRLIPHQHTEREKTADLAVDLLPPIPGGIKRSRSTMEQQQQAASPAPPQPLPVQHIKRELSTPLSPAPIPCTNGFISKKDLIASRQRSQVAPSSADTSLPAPSHDNGCTTSASNTTAATTTNTTTGDHAPAAAVLAPTTTACDAVSPTAGVTGVVDVKPEGSPSPFAEDAEKCRAVIACLVLRTSILGDDYQPPPPRNNTTTTPGGATTNFKRFSKTQHGKARRCPALAAPPLIIGGKDLVRHQDTLKHRDKETWFTQHPEAWDRLEQERREEEERLREDNDRDLLETPFGSLSNRGSSRRSRNNSNRAMVGNSSKSNAGVPAVNSSRSSAGRGSVGSTNSITNFFSAINSSSVASIGRANSSTTSHADAGSLPFGLPATGRVKRRRV